MFTTSELDQLSDVVPLLLRLFLLSLVLVKQLFLAAVRLFLSCSIILFVDLLRRRIVLVQQLVVLECSFSRQIVLNGCVRLLWIIRHQIHQHLLLGLLFDDRSRHSLDYQNVIA